ncbi:methionyl-tRNA formyltransferase [Undibacterium jejuense]|uniref:Methionyl-tRNA formyltransferase n=1 Tax=Undibacterium jejuense TaxID=1344949 RepID=A0A923HFN3_9BURK|nr:methionyl-tRNA formyltransferase [Undibacterium jejuense]MBC3862165.1 methionyl-tRNA formyltransferase [Undibacterium jejuense]
MKVIFAGTPEFAAIALAALHQAGHEIVLVLTQPDRPAGRGMQLQASAVKQYALAHNMPVVQPVSLRLDGKYPEIATEAHALLHSTPHDVMVVAAYGLILPLSVLNIPRLGCLNIHGSLLPRWRGAAPIHRAIEVGDSETGITIMQMEEGLDTGPMLLTESVAIKDTDTTGSLHDTLAAMGGKMIVEALHLLEQGQLPATVQPEQGVTYAAKISKEEASLDFLQSADTLARKIRAFNPFPATHAQYGDKAIKIFAAHAVAKSSHDVEPGTVLSASAHDGITVACGEGCLQLTELQKPGGKRLPAADFLQGFPLPCGSSFALKSSSVQQKNDSF